MLRGLVLVAIVAVQAAASPQIPVDGLDYTEFRELPELVNPKFLAPTPQEGVALPQEPKEITIALGDTLRYIKYWFAADDRVADVYKFIAERTGQSMSSILSLQHLRLDVIGRTATDIPYSTTTKLKDIPLIAGDELEVKFRPPVDENDIKITANPAEGKARELPGFFDVKIKLAGMKMFSVPVPRLAHGNVVKGIVEDHAALSQYSAQLYRTTRDGTVLMDSDLLSDLDSFFWGILVPKSELKLTTSNTCESGQLRLLLSNGRSHMFKFNCKTKTKDVRAALDNLGLLPDPVTTPYGIIMSTKGFFHTDNIDALRDDDLIVDRGARDDGMIFVTVACPTTLVYFTYIDKSMPQILNCTTTLEYLTPIFNRISGREDDVPRYTFISNDMKTKTLVPNQPVMKQLDGVTRLIVNIDYAPCGSESPSPSMPPSPTPSPSARVVKPFDSEDYRTAPAPEGAIKLGDGTLLQRASKWRVEEQSKYRHTDR